MADSASPASNDKTAMRAAQTVVPPQNEHQVNKVEMFGQRFYWWEMKIAIASDHAGFAYKEKIKALLTRSGHDVQDFGTMSEEPVDYPVFIRPAAEAVARGECERGIVLGGSGNGEAIAANKVHRIRCALCWNEATAKWSRQHNDANVLSLGQRTIGADTALQIVRVWLETPFEGGRHLQRVQMIEPG